MKSLNNSILEKLAINKDSKSEIHGYYNTNTLKAQYAIVYPNGYMELFTENGLKDFIKSLEDELEKEDSSDIEEMLVTYQELSEITEIRKWVGLSGPADDNSVIDNTYGIKLRK